MKKRTLYAVATILAIIMIAGCGGTAKTANLFANPLPAHLPQDAPQWLKNPRAGLLKTDIVFIGKSEALKDEDEARSSAQLDAGKRYNTFIQNTALHYIFYAAKQMNTVKPYVPSKRMSVLGGEVRDIYTMHQADGRYTVYAWYIIPGTDVRDSIDLTLRSLREDEYVPDYRVIIDRALRLFRGYNNF